MRMALPTSQGGGTSGVDMSESANMGAPPAPDLTPPSMIGCTRDDEKVDGVKARLAQLCARDDELTAVIERAIAEREAVRAEMSSVNDELDVLVNRPVSGGRDPTLSLPDELMEMILLMAPFEAMWGGVLKRVCRCGGDGLCKRALW